MYFGVTQTHDLCWVPLGLHCV